jgi:hypothetical protein
MSNVWVQVEWEVHHIDVGHAVITEEEFNELKESPDYPKNFCELDFEDVEYGEYASSGNPISIVSTVEGDDVDFIQEFDQKKYIYIVSVTSTAFNIPHIRISHVFDDYKNCEREAVLEVSNLEHDFYELYEDEIVTDTTANTVRKWIHRDDYDTITVEIQEIL